MKEREKGREGGGKKSEREKEGIEKGINSPPLQRQDQMASSVRERGTNCVIASTWKL